MYVCIETKEQQRISKTALHWRRLDGGETRGQPSLQVNEKALFSVSEAGWEWLRDHVEGDQWNEEFCAGERDNCEDVEARKQDWRAGCSDAEAGLETPGTLGASRRFKQRESKLQKIEKTSEIGRVLKFILYG